MNDLIPPGGFVIVVRNVFDPGSGRRVPFEGKFIDFLQAHYPTGFGDFNAHVFINQDLVKVEDFDREIGEDDYATLLLIPKDPVTAGTAFAAFLATYTASTVVATVAYYAAYAAVSAAISFAIDAVVNALVPKAKTDKRSAKRVYEISSSQNVPALGSVIPEHFGQLWFSPTLASQPYTYFDDNNQYLEEILLIGQGEYRIDAIRLGETLIGNFPPGVVQYWIFDKNTHKQMLGPIQQTTGVLEDVVTSYSVNNIDMSLNANYSWFGKVNNDGYNSFRSGTADPRDTFVIGETVNCRLTGAVNDGKTFTVRSMDSGELETNPECSTDGDDHNWYQLYDPTFDDGWRGWYDVCPAFKQTNLITVDFAWAGGINYIDSNGGIGKAFVTMTYEVQALDNSGNAVGAVTKGSWTVSGSTRNPIRKTFSITVTTGRYRIRIKKTSNDDRNTSSTTRTTWSALKAVCVNPTNMSAYGDVTLLVMRIFASNALSGGSADRVSVQATRKLQIKGAGALTATKNPIDAFVYIGSRVGGLDALQMDTLATQHTKFAGTTGFNYRYDDLTTVFEALQVVTGELRGTPSAYARKMGIMLDRAQTTDKWLFSDEQALSATVTVSIGRADLTTDGYRVEYQDSNSLSRFSYTYPTNAVNPSNVFQPGITDLATATAHAKYLWYKKSALRRVCEFETEFDGHNLEIGQRFAFNHSYSEWLSTGRVMAWTPSQITLDKVLDAIGSCFIVLRDQYGKPSGDLNATILPDGKTISVPGGMPFPIFTPFDGQDPTTVIIGTTDTVKRSYICHEITPSDGSVNVKGYGYDGEAYKYPIPGET